MIQNKPVAIVTGASSGFGERTAARLVQHGYRVFGTSRSPKPHGHFEMLVLDVDSDASVRAFLTELEQRTERIDVLINNAGRAAAGACEETSAAEARALFETNLFGVMRMVSAVAPRMRAQRRGSIVNVGSLSGLISVPFHGTYAASKHALAGYTDALRHELRPFGIRVSLVEPAVHGTGIRMASPAHPLSAYEQARERVCSVLQAQVMRGDDPERVVDVILRAVNSAWPRARYRVGRKARLAALAVRLLPRAWLERLVRREFRLPTFDNV